MTTPLIIAIALALIIAVPLLLSILFRIVVSTNEVHIVQSAQKTVAFGKDQTNGNKYYRWPSWVPRIGIRVISLPVSVFDLVLKDYPAYDKGRVPFEIDIIAFFRVTDPNTAAQRIQSIQELKEQLRFILQGAIRTILATSEIEEILEGRSKFGEMFTTEVDHQLVEWGVQSVKQIELMDIRDIDGSHVIQNIMAKKKSLIEMQSRIEVAGNQQRAQVAEITAEQEVATQQQQAKKIVGVRTAEQERDVGVAQEQAQQTVKDQAKITAEKDMAVQQVRDVKAADIARQVQVVGAEQERQVAITRAEGHRQQTILIAEGNLQNTKLTAEGIEVDGKARAEAAKALQLAPVHAQITLAKEIGGNAGYQQYLLTLRQIDAAQIVGIEQAKALEKAGIKVFATTGDAVAGVTSVMELFTPKGGLRIGAMLDALGSTDAGRELIGAVQRVAGTPKADAPSPAVPAAAGESV